MPALRLSRNHLLWLSSLSSEIWTEKSQQYNGKNRSRERNIKILTIQILIIKHFTFIQCLSPQRTLKHFTNASVYILELLHPPVKCSHFWGGKWQLFNNITKECETGREELKTYPIKIWPTKRTSTSLLWHFCDRGSDSKVYTLLIKSVKSLGIPWEVND